MHSTHIDGAHFNGGAGVDCDGVGSYDEKSNLVVVVAVGAAIACQVDGRYCADWAEDVFCRQPTAANYIRQVNTNCHAHREGAVGRIRKFIIEIDLEGFLGFRFGCATCYSH